MGSIKVQGTYQISTEYSLKIIQRRIWYALLILDKLFLLLDNITTRKYKFVYKLQYNYDL